MPVLVDFVLDLALGNLNTNGNRLDICVTEPTTYGQATTAGTHSLGNKTALDIGAPADRVVAGNGRRVTVASFADGTVTTTGLAAWWAITDTTNTRLLATGALAASQNVTASNTFSLAAFDIGIPDVA